METIQDQRFAAACDERHARESDAADAEFNRRASLIWCDWCGDYEVAAEGQRCSECLTCEAEDNHEAAPDRGVDEYRYADLDEEVASGH